ncbi:cell division protein ZapD [Thiobacillus sedimenti]|uniref:Cell division protein ZapD n=1 Tax=Thiobacillus sedimenti TaxID=3110231 RepID=A0ABZ1CIQ8_9PROT|nr:cell division protein ZapD [Thiobacillus sp. SCUT-2]WRS38830.1 cell division protein ZapD [Thiobacillus sp. SCUT-2]
MIHYEYPLSERIRTLLRLEDLFDRFDAYAASPDPHAHHAALLTLFEMAEVAARADLKSDLLQELDRQKAVLAALRGNPHVQGATLEQVLAAIEAAHQGMYQLPGKVGQHLREDDWLMAIKQRAAIPGGMCEFDLPSYHYWLHQAADVRVRQLQQWLAPFSSIRSAVGIVLGLLRDSGQPELQHAKNGTYQRMLESRNPQLIRVTLVDELPCVPEMSANKYMLNIRFVHAGPGAMRTCADVSVDFDLTFCTL